MRLELPVVRPRALPKDAARLEWHEGGDLPAAGVVMLVGALGALLGWGNLTRGVAGVEALVALAFVLVGALGVLAALSELVRAEDIAVRDRVVIWSWRGLGRRLGFSEPLTGYEGVAPVDRRRRFFVRNQGLPATGRRGPTSEFVLVLRHREDRAKDLELFRAQPSLSALREVHAVRAARGGPDVAECERVARGYRDALVSLCASLGLPALVPGDDGEPVPVDALSLDLWLERNV